MEYHLNLLTPKTERILVQLVILKRWRRTFVWHITQSKVKKNVVVLLTSSPLQSKTIDDGKEKSRIIKFYDFTKGGKDIVYHLNDHCTARSKSYCWVMVALSYMLYTARFNWKTVWCLKNDSDISSTSSYDFDWNLAKALALPHVQRQSLNDVAPSVQLKIKIFLETALLVDEPIPKVERRFTGTGQRGRCQSPMANCHTTTEKRNAPKSTEKCQSYVISLCQTHSMRVCNGCLQWNFILYFIFIVLSFSFML